MNDMYIYGAYGVFFLCLSVLGFISYYKKKCHDTP